MAENEIGDAGILGCDALVQGADVVGHFDPAVLVGGIAQILGILGGIAVAQMVLGADQIAVVGHKAGKAVITANVLGDAVHQLENRLGCAVFRGPGAAIEGRGAVCGGETKFLIDRHGKIAPFVVKYFV